MNSNAFQNDDVWAAFGKALATVLVLVIGVVIIITAVGCASVPRVQGQVCFDSQGRPVLKGEARALPLGGGYVVDAPDATVRHRSSDGDCHPSKETADDER